MSTSGAGLSAKRPERGDARHERSDHSAAGGSLSCERRARWRVTRTCAALSITLAAITAPSRAATAQPPAAWTLVREMAIGSSDGADPYLFTKIMATLPTARGSLVVFDSRPNGVRVLGPTGAFTHSVGRVGRGPGEFVLLNRIGLIGDTVWMSDRTLRRTTLFGLDGGVIKTLAWEAVPGAAGGALNTVEGLFADGTAWGENNGHIARVMRGGPELPKPILRMSRAGATLDTIVIVPTSHTMFAFMNGPRGTFGSQKFADGALVIGAPSQSRLYVVGRAVATSARTANVSVVALRPTGDTLWRRDLTYLPRKLEKAAADSFVGQIKGSSADDDAIRRLLFIPEFRPPVASGFAADDGTLWLRREEGRATVEYWIVSPEGKLTATLLVPQSLALTAARGAQVWGVEKNADDVPVVVRFRIAR